MSSKVKLILLALVVGVAWGIVRWSDAPGPPVPVPAPRAVRPELPKATDAQIAELMAPLEARLAASARPAVKIELEAMADDVLWVSKVGGAPYLEAGEEMPVTEDGKPMVLLAQIDFAEVPETPGYPRRGLLQVFIVRDSEERLYGMNVRERSVEGLMRQHSFRTRFIAEPRHVPVMVRRVAPGAKGATTPHQPHEPRRMRFVSSSERISAQDANFASVVGVEAYTWCEQAASRLGVDIDDLAERAFPSAGGHKLGGYPYFTQSDPRPAGTPLRLLLQLDTDEEMMWGDAGVGGFFIDPADLARGDFSRVLYNWDCS